MNSNVILPDFIIAGAMKCGTSSLHTILSGHPKIFIPDKEIFFYDLDDYEQHPAFFAYEGNEWHYPKFEENLDEYLSWYSSFFDSAPDGSVIGEDSTTYIASKIGARRIAEINPEAKIIIMLRDPASRSYSHYFHNVRAGRSSMNFEESMKFEDGNILRRSYYKEQIENFLEYVSTDQIEFVIFEEFIADMDNVLENIVSFIGVDPALLNLEDVNTHTNKHNAKLSAGVNLWKNKLIKKKLMKRYYGHLPWTSSISNTSKINNRVIIEKIHKAVNPPRSQKPKMKIETHAFLDNYLKARNNGIEDLLGKQIDKYWYKTISDSDRKMQKTI
jgi:hypothetical protein